MHVMDGVAHVADMGLFQDGACPPPSAPSAIRDTLTPPPPTLAPPPPPLAPPPPPPPPPLLPPPLLPGLGDPSAGLKRIKSVRKLFWKTIPEHQVKGRPNLWTQGPAEQHQIDVQSIEELFGHDDAQSNAKVAASRGGRSRTSFRETKEEVCILDAKRGMNIGIFLKQFKRSNQSIVEDVRCGNSSVYGPEPLRELLKLLPESDEVKKLRAFRGDVSKLSLADSFVYLLVQLPSYVVRIESMLLKEEFPAESDSMKHDIRTLRSAIKELMCCEELHTVLHLVLQAGNILNAGGYAGNAVGFKLSSLPSLAETKANKPGMNLLHFVALEAQKQNEKLLEFPLKLGHVQAASRISLDTLDSELQRLVSRTRSIEENVLGDSELKQQLHTFLQSAASALCSLRGCRQQLKSESEELLDFFCEDRESFKLDDCFSIFTSFCLKFTSAVRDNAERERKEAARRRRLQELEEQKRHSWAAGEQFGGAFGLRSSSELDVQSALSRNDEAGLLMELLMPRSHPRSPLLRRSGSFGRSRNSTKSDVRVSEFRDAEKRDSSVSLRVPNEQKRTNNDSGVATDYLRNREMQAKAANPTSDLNNNGKEACSDQTSFKDQLPTEHSSKTTEKSTCSAGNMSVKVEKCTLVPELKAFDKVPAPTRSGTQNDAALTDFDEEKPEEKVESTDKDAGDTVIVWCVTGVCEVDDTQSSDRNVAGNLSERMPSNDQNAAPISSQPQPSIRLPEIATEAKKVEGGSGLVGESEGDRTNQGRGSVSDGVGSQEVSTVGLNAELSNNKELKSRGLESSETVVETVQNRSETTEHQIRELENVVSDEQNVEKPVKKPQDSKTAQNVKPSMNGKTESTPKKASSSKTSGKLIRALTTTESDNMRRVVPISRTNSAKVTNKPPGTQRGMSSLSVPNRSASHRLERPSTAPSSRRSSFNKADTQEAESGKKAAAKKTQEKKKSQQDEKICRSQLRSMNQKEAREVSSAPVTPIHKTTPGFARNTASSSLRRTNTTLEKSSTNKNAPSLQNSANTSPKFSPKTLSPKISPKSASAQNDETISSKISPPKILSPKLSSRNAKSSMSPTSRNTESGSNAKVSSVKSPNTNPSQNSLKTSTLPSVQKPTIEISSASNDREDSAKCKNENSSRSDFPDLTNNETNLNESGTLALSASSSKSSANSNNESPKKISTFHTKLSPNSTKSNVASSVSSHSVLATPPQSQFSINSNQVPSEMIAENESLNLTNNNCDIPQNSTTQMSLHGPALQNSTNNNNSNAKNAEKSTNSQPKILSPKAVPRSINASNSPSRLSPNNNSNLSPGLPTKSLKSPTLSRPGSFRVPSSPKSPDLGSKTSPSVRAPPRSQPSDTPPGGRRRNDSGSFSEKSVQSTKDPRPTWR